MQKFTFTGADGFMVLQYIPIIASATRYYSSIDRRVSLVWPKREADMNYQHGQKQNLLRLLMSNVLNGSFTSSPRSQSLDLISYLLRLLNPPLKHSMHSGPSTQLSSTEEKTENTLLDVIQLMESFGLTYGPVPYSYKERNAPVQASYGLRQPQDEGYNSMPMQLQPNIERLLEFGIVEVKGTDDEQPSKQPYGSYGSYTSVDGPQCMAGFEAGSTGLKHMVSDRQRRYVIEQKIQRIRDSVGGDGDVGRGVVGDGGVGRGVGGDGGVGGDVGGDISKGKEQCIKTEVKTEGLPMEVDNGPTSQPAILAIQQASTIIAPDSTIIATKPSTKRPYSFSRKAPVSSESGQNLCAKSNGSSYKGPNGNGNGNGNGSSGSKEKLPYFKFVQGFSSAVRRNVTIEEFM